MLKVEEAERIILDSVSELETVRMKIPYALNMVLAEDVYSGINIPPFDDSAMDGYAVKAMDTNGAAQESPIILQVIDNISAGVSKISTIIPNTAAKIMTGAPLPNGADSVVMVEDTEENDGWVKIFRKTGVGENIRPKGEDVAEGELVLKKGTSISAAKIGMLAALGRKKIEVIRSAEVSIISTGNELIDIDTEMTWGKKRDSNGYALEAQVIEALAKPRRLGIFPDEHKKIKEAILSALSSDVVIISGGVSMGDYDIVTKVLEEIGAIVKFTEVAIRPGKPFTFAMCDKKPIFALPGNPVSTMVCFEVFVRCALLKMMGHKNIHRHKITAVLTEDFKKKAGRKYFLRAKIKTVNNYHQVSLTGPQGSGILKSLVLANALVVIPEEVTKLEKGEEVEVYLLD